MLANDSLTTKQQTFITAYLTPGLTIEAAAKVAGIAEKTAYRYLKLAHVQAGIKKARADIYEQSIGGLVHLIDKSIATLERNLDGDASTASTQVRAALGILAHSHMHYVDTAVDERLARLEEDYEARG